jgi:tetraacyldisaccharide 4'-kinase
VLNKSYFEDLIYGRKHSLFWGPFLLVVSWLYGAAIFVRYVLYRLNLITRKELACTVISVGNITVGGTGKTPTVITIATLLRDSQKHPVVVSRGYGRKNESKTIIVSDGRSILVGPESGGDEPVLIGSKLPGVPVVVGQKRYEAAVEALRRFNADVVILDDGFQHIQLKRTLDLVLVDANDPFGNGLLFPAGILREPMTALKRAHAVLITKIGRSEDTKHLQDIIGKKTRGKIFTSRMIPVDVVDCDGGGSHPLSFLRNRTVLACSAIARPESFNSLLQSLGASVEAQSIYPDHHVFTKADLEDLYKKAVDNKVDIIITTEKDAVRLKHLKPQKIFALRIELSVNEREEWESFLLGNV